MNLSKLEVGDIVMLYVKGEGTRFLNTSTVREVCDTYIELANKSRHCKSTGVQIRTASCGRGNPNVFCESSKI